MSEFLKDIKKDDLEFNQDVVDVLNDNLEEHNNVNVECLALSIQTAKQLAEHMKISKIINKTNRITEDLLVSITKSVNEQGVEILKRSTEAVISQEALEKSLKTKLDMELKFVDNLTRSFNNGTILGVCMKH